MTRARPRICRNFQTVFASSQLLTHSTQRCYDSDGCRSLYRLQAVSTTRLA